MTLFTDFGGGLSSAGRGFGGVPMPTAAAFTGFGFSAEMPGTLVADAGAAVLTFFGDVGGFLVIFGLTLLVVGV